MVAGKSGKGQPVQCGKSACEQRQEGTNFHNGKNRVKRID